MSEAINNHPFQRYINLAEPRLGAEAIFATDEWFADKSRMLKTEPGVFIPGKFDDNGKWMDGWETRRKRTEGYDYCIVKLGKSGTIRGVNIDTSNFTGNYPPAASIDACYSYDGNLDEAEWVEILPSVSLKGDSHHFHTIDNQASFSHVRLNIYPDGGVARLRIYGEPQCNWGERDPAKQVDLLAIENGGRAVTCNDQHFGSIMNLNMPGRGINMGDGWETRRRREPGNDWAIMQLGHAGVIEAVHIDTAHFKGNYPDQCSIQAAYMKGGTEQSLVTQSMFWKELLPPQKLEMDALHDFAEQVKAIGPVTHVRINIIPDGGLSRVRLLGHIATED
uniref:Probable allantoicase n=1 Tax=uncultured Thiotrichaceae bacterium TaxID=298394 RepID=A0A6S6UL95_9GAMM|nr:MAG: Allantoicase (EC [uncultured Thiotrichaceae bacterium]